MTRVLIIEDDADTASEIAIELTRLGFSARRACDGREGLALGSTEAWDAMIVDRMLPLMDGLSVVRGLRDRGVGTPVLVLSALGAVDDRILGLRAGGDDYLVKPFALGELSARLEALLRRPAAVVPVTLRVGALQIDLVARAARRGQRELELLAREFQLLEYLARRPGQVVTRKMLLEDIFGYRFELRTNLVDVHMGRLRRKLDHPGEPAMLSTIRGLGFSLGTGD